MEAGKITQNQEGHVREKLPFCAQKHHLVYQDYHTVQLFYIHLTAFWKEFWKWWNSNESVFLGSNFQFLTTKCYKSKFWQIT